MRVAPQAKHFMLLQREGLCPNNQASPHSSLPRKRLSINAKTCFEGLSTTGLRVHQVRVFPLTLLSLSKGAFRENRQTPLAGGQKRTRYRFIARPHVRAGQPASWADRLTRFAGRG